MQGTFYIKIYNQLIFLLTIVAVFPTYGQPCDNDSIDSLNQLANSGNIEATEKIDLLNQIAKCYLDIDLDSTANYAEKAKFLSMEMGYKKGMAVSIFRLAQIEKTLGHYDQAVPMFKNVIELYDGLDKDSDYLQAINLIGIIYEIQQDFDKSIDYYLIGLREAELQGQKLFIAYFHNNISIIYGYTGFQDKKLIHIKKASEMFKELGHDNYYANSLLNIGIYYKRLKEFDTAFVYFFEAEKLQKKNNNYYGLTNLYHNFGDISLEKNQLEDALSYYQKSLEYAKMLNSLDPDRRSLISSANFNIGNAFLKLGRFSLAKDYFYKAYSEGKFLKSMFRQKESSYGLFTCFLGLDQNDSAMYYHNIFLAMNDSLVAEAYNEKIDKLSYEYELEKERELLEKDKKLILLEKNKQELIYLIIVGILSVIATIIFIIWYYQKTRLEKSELNRKNLQLEKENISNTLDKKNRELATSVLNLIERNEFIAEISERLQNKDGTSISNTSESIKEIVKTIDKDATNKLWKEFELRYMEVHKDFYQKLTTLYPDLTSNERKLCAFMILNMSTKDISSITYQSEHSIKIARYRLRKKLGLSKNENLISFLHNL